MQKTDIDHRRMLGIFPIQEWDQEGIDIIGAGALGSRLAYELSTTLKYVTSICVTDFDWVERGNVPPSVYWKSHAERNAEGQPSTRKVDALREVIAFKCGLSRAEISEYYQSGILPVHSSIGVQIGYFGDTLPEKLSQDPEIELNPPIDGKVVFLMVDSMQSRREIMSRIKRDMSHVDLVIEARVGKEDGMIFSINPHNQDDYDFWLSQSSYDDPPQNPGFCNQSQTANSAVSMAVGRILQQFYIWSRIKYCGSNEEIKRQLILGWTAFGLPIFS